MNSHSFEAFETDARAAGFDEAVVRGTPHDERYGPQGATYWVARRNPR
ncbi:hypothetical protein BH11PSE9_BH11PSE9_33170 [soil metagenome]